MKNKHGAKFTGSLMEWRATPEGKKTFEAQRAAFNAKGGKGSQNSNKQKGEFNGMTKAQVKKMKRLAAEVKALKSDDHAQQVYQAAKAALTSSNETSSGGSSTSASSSSGGGADKGFQNFEMILKSLQKDVPVKKEEE